MADAQIINGAQVGAEAEPTVTAESGQLAVRILREASNEAVEKRVFYSMAFVLALWIVLAIAAALIKGSL